MSISTIKAIKHFNDPNYWIGYKFIMSDKSKSIICKIENASKCCEKWGIHIKNDINEFIGAEYYSVNIGNIHKEPYEYMTTLKVTINTSKGDIVICIYNEHNGYYSHDVYIQTENSITNISL